jgi:hypothetical protein
MYLWMSENLQTDIDLQLVRGMHANVFDLSCRACRTHGAGDMAREFITRDM